MQHALLTKYDGRGTKEHEQATLIAITNGFFQPTE